MSKIYSESHIICSCNQINTNEILNGISHCLADIYFCPSCQCHKCRNCCLYNIEGKFCSNCLTHYGSKETYCTKNCFSCPVCTSNLSISVSSGEDNGVNGKRFKFKCTFCEFHYDTGLVTKPKPLTSIIRSERRSADRFSNLFFKYSEYLKDHEKASYSNNQHPVLDEEMIKKLNMMDLAHLTKLNENDIIRRRMEENSAVDINKQEDIKMAKKIAGINKLSQLNPTNNYLTDSSIYNSNINNKFPLPRKLTTKKSYRCLTCNYHLLLPRSDSIKFDVKYNAVDFTPSVNISKLEDPKILKPGHQVNFLLNFSNPLDIPLMVRISTVPQLKINKDITAMITLPVLDFTINGATKIKNTIHSIPTSLLTSNTPISRSEIMFRMGKSLSKAQGDNMVDIAEEGVNWCSIPVYIVLDDIKTAIITESNHKIQIPFYIGITSSLPSSLEGKSQKTKLSYSYWNVIDLGNFTITK